MQALSYRAILTGMLATAFAIAEAVPTAGAAPKGDAKTVASRIIKYNFPACKRVTSAERMPHGQILANCDGVQYLVFTVFDPDEGKLHEIAMNCNAAKRLLNLSC
ncbi:MAG TPA: hypothetical protein VFU71_18100 [Burkholderiaceae bacterium]|nr:hypothetical protein [Burkholderiaceae bacterium]